MGLRRKCRKLHSALAFSLAAAMLFGNFSFSGITGNLAEVKAAPDRKVVKELGNVDADAASNLIADGLSEKSAEKAEALSEEYWKTDAPKDMDEAALDYVDAMDIDPASDKQGKGGEGIALGGEGLDGLNKKETAKDLDDLHVDTYEKKFDENGLRETKYFVRLSYTQANPKYLKLETKTIDDLMFRNKEALLTNIVSTASLYESKDYPDSYVAFLDFGGQNGTASKIMDYEFVIGDETSPRSIKDDVVFDTKTGILYIPKSYYFALDGSDCGLDINGQILTVANDEQPEIAVSIENEAGVVLGKVKSKMSISTYDAPVFPLIAKEDAGKVDFEDIEVYVNGSSAKADLTDDDTAKYDKKTGEYTLYQYGQTIYSIKFRIKGKTIASRVKDFLSPVEVSAAGSAVGQSMKAIKNVDTGEELKPEIEVDKLNVKDTYWYAASGTGGHNTTLAKKMIHAGQGSFVYAPKLPTSTKTSSTDPCRDKLYAAVTEEKGSDSTTLEGLVSKINAAGAHGLCVPNEQNPDSDWRAGKSDKLYWYKFVVDCPDGNVTDVGNSSHVVSFGKTSQWCWSNTFADKEGYGSWVNHGYVAMCAHVGTDAVEGDGEAARDCQVSVLEKTDDYVILSFAGTSAYSKGSDDDDDPTASTQCGVTILKVNVEQPGFAQVRKKSADDKIVKDNPCYSLEGAKYGVYTDAACATTPIAELITDAEGNTNIATLKKGMYYIKEIEPSKGYLLDSKVYPITVQPKELTTVSCYEVPAHTDPNIRLVKWDKDRKSPNPTKAKKKPTGFIFLCLFDVVAKK